MSNTVAMPSSVESAMRLDVRPNEENTVAATAAECRLHCQPHTLADFNLTKSESDCTRMHAT